MIAGSARKESFYSTLGSSGLAVNLQS